jgi:hypothetical protein
MVLGHRMLLDRRVPAQAAAYYSGQYQDYYVKVLTSVLPPDGVALDVGANIGFFTLPLARAAKGGASSRLNPILRTAPGFARISD